MTKGICPNCNGTGRVSAAGNRYKTVYASYDAATDTLGCSNCGRQYQNGIPTGEVLLRKDNGEPCVHEYTSKILGRCYEGYTCKHCGDYYTIDSSD